MARGTACLSRPEPQSHRPFSSVLACIRPAFARTTGTFTVIIAPVYAGKSVETLTTFTFLSHLISHHVTYCFTARVSADILSEYATHATPPKRRLLRRVHSARHTYMVSSRSGTAWERHSDTGFGLYRLPLLFPSVVTLRATSSGSHRLPRPYGT